MVINEIFDKLKVFEFLSLRNEFYKQTGTLLSDDEETAIEEINEFRKNNILIMEGKTNFKPTDKLNTMNVECVWDIFIEPVKEKDYDVKMYVFNNKKYWFGKKDNIWQDISNIEIHKLNVFKGGF